MTLRITEQPPFNTDDELKAYLTRLFRNIENAFEEVNYLSVDIALPKNPINGEIRYFGFTNATITTKGFWGYEEGIWVKL